VQTVAWVPHQPGKVERSSESPVLADEGANRVCNVPTFSSEVE